jgi:DNA-nicking Smr family endonuclease
MTKRPDPDWAAALKDVKPLKGKRTLPPLPLPLPLPSSNKQLPLPVRVMPSTPLALGQSAGLDTRTYKKLRSGKMEIEGRLDLHGETRASAEVALARFLKFSITRGRRCVLIVTGKSGVIRQELPVWLNSALLRPHILALTPAQPEDGGSGAVYVLLKRKPT